MTGDLVFSVMVSSADTMTRPKLMCCYLGTHLLDQRSRKQGAGLWDCKSKLSGILQLTTGSELARSNILSGLMQRPVQKSHLSFQKSFAESRLQIASNTEQGTGLFAAPQARWV